MAATLLEDRTIRFDSLTEFLQHYDSHIRNGGFFLESPAEWHERRPMVFHLRIAGVDESIGLVAEPAFSGGGKVALQIPGGSVVQDALADLVGRLKTGPVLGEDGSIVFKKGSSFLAERAALLAGDFQLECQGSWSPGEARDFTLKIDEQDLVVAIRARVVAAEGSRATVRLESSPDVLEAIQVLTDFLSSPAASQPAQPPDETTPAPAIESGAGPAGAHPPDAAGLPPAEPDQEPGFQGFSGSIVSSHDGSEFRSARPAQFGPDERHTTTLYQLVSTLAASNRAAEAVIAAGGSNMEFRFNDEGLLVEYRGPNSDVDFLERLGAAGHIDTGLRDKLRSDLTDDGSAVQLVRSLHAATDQAVRGVLQDQAIDALEAIRSTGRVSFQVRPIPDQPVGGVRFGSLIVPWMKRGFGALDSDQAKAFLAPLWPQHPRLNETPAWGLNFLDVSDTTHDRVRGLDGSRTLQDVVEAIPRDESQVVFWEMMILLSLGTLEMLEAKSAEPQPPLQAAPAARAPARHPAPAPAVDDSPDQELAAEIDRLEKRGNPFDLLEVHWSAHPGAYPQALKNLQDRLGPGSGLAADLRQRRLQLAREALAQLSDVDQRLYFRQKFVPSSNLLGAGRMMWEKALGLIREEKLTDAITHLEMAVEFDPVPAYRDKLELIRRKLKKKQGS